MNPLDVVFWSLTAVVVVGAVALIVIIVAGVFHAFRRPKSKPKPESTPIMYGRNDG